MTRVFATLVDTPGEVELARPEGELSRVQILQRIEQAGFYRRENDPNTYVSREAIISVRLQEEPPEERRFEEEGA